MSSLKELPLFPLSTVLFPGMILPLHIFEERYKKMVSDCLRDDQPFGVVLIQEGAEVGNGATIFDIGTAAQITQVERMDDGRMNIATLGLHRFKIHELFADKEPYLVGLIKDFPFEENNAQLVANCVRALSPILRKYLETLVEVSQIDATIGEIPKDAATLAYLAAILIRAPMRDKQNLLSIASLDEVLQVECKLLLEEAQTLKFITYNIPKWKDETLPFSPN